MARKPAPKAAKQEEDEEEDEDEEEEGQEARLPWEQELEQWYTEEAMEGEVFRFVLYRRPGPNSMARAREKVWEWEGEKPNSHEIGLRFGGGLYTGYGILPPKAGSKKTRIISRHFVLGDSYTQEMRRRLRLEAQENGYAIGAPHWGTPPQPPPAASNGLQDALQIMKEVFLPMMQHFGAAQAKPAGAFDQLKEFSAVAGQIVRDTTRAQLEMAKEASREIANLKDGKKAAGQDEDEAPSEGEFVTAIKELIMDNGQDLVDLVKDTFKYKRAKRMIEGDLVFQSLSQNKVLYDRVLGHLQADPDVDKDMLSKVLGKLAEMGFGANVKPAPALPPNGHAAPHRPAAPQGAATAAQ